jgi:hypothetical protein
MSHASAAAYAGDHLPILVEKIKFMAYSLAVPPPLFFPGIVYGHFSEAGEGAAVPAAVPDSLPGHLQIGKIETMAGGAKIGTNPAIDALG